VGYSIMIDEEYDKLRTWFDQRVVPQMANESHYGEAWDMDQIYGREYQRPWDVDRAIDGFQYLQQLSIRAFREVETLLVIHLRQSLTLDPAPPVFVRPAELDVSTYHPPTLTFRKRLHPEVMSLEIYHSILEVGGTPLAGISERWYYECWRTQEAKGLGEPFDRDIVIAA
jgi:hypothetical protein